MGPCIYFLLLNEIISLKIHTGNESEDWPEDNILSINIYFFFILVSASNLSHARLMWLEHNSFIAKRKQGNTVDGIMSADDSYYIYC